MTYTTLISTTELAGHLDDPGWIVVDCRFSLEDTKRGRRDYLKAHIPGAVYAHLDKDLSAKIIPGLTSRHPLPAPEALAETLGQWGIDQEAQVVAYDDWGGVVAARLWWMLRWLGHRAAAVLDGGWPHWVEEGRPTSHGQESRAAKSFIPQPNHEMIVEANDVATLVQERGKRLFDARSADRYRGENETLDPVAGHIPGAHSAPYADNLTPENLFRPKEELRQHYQDLLDGTKSEDAVFYCGSGVSAAHNLLAIAYAGLGQAILYPGSWSEWVTDPGRPVATGEEP